MNIEKKVNVFTFDDIVRPSSMMMSKTVSIIIAVVSFIGGIIIGIVAVKEVFPHSNACPPGNYSGRQQIGGRKNSPFHPHSLAESNVTYEFADEFSFVVVDNKVRVGAKFQVVLNVKVNRRIGLNSSAVVLSVSGKQDFLLVRMDGAGRVYLSAENGGGPFTAMFSKANYVNDGDWHTITAKYIQ